MWIKRMWSRQAIWMKNKNIKKQIKRQIDNAVFKNKLKLNEENKNKLKQRCADIKETQSVFQKVSRVVDCLPYNTINSTSV